MKAKKFPAFSVSASYADYAEGKQFREEQHTLDNRCNLQDLQEMSEEAGLQKQDGQEQTTIEACIDAVLRCVGSQNSLREILYKTLVFSEEPHEFDELEDFIASQDEFRYSHIIQTPYTLIQMLLRCGGLNDTPLDEQGEVLSEERMCGLSPDEVDDLVATYRIETSDAGILAAKLIDPARRLDAQLAQKPHRAHTFYALLDFCRHPRSFPEIQEFFENTSGLARDTVATFHTLAPDFYVDKLDKAGALVWRGAWVTTQAGSDYLAAHAPEFLDT